MLFQEKCIRRGSRAAWKNVDLSSLHALSSFFSFSTILENAHEPQDGAEEVVAANGPRGHNQGLDAVLIRAGDGPPPLTLSTRPFENANQKATAAAGNREAAGN